MPASKFTVSNFISIGTKAVGKFYFSSWTIQMDLFFLESTTTKIFENLLFYV